MAAGKKKKSGKEFKSSPFKQLKGLCVSPPEEKKTPPVPAGKKTSPRTGAEEVGFADEMARLGVERLGGGEAAEAAGKSAVEPAEKTADQAQSPPADEEELFLAALGNMDAVFRDQVPESEEPTPPGPRRMKLLRQGKLHPEGTLDLHGRTREEARQQVEFFLDDALYQGWKTVLIITGRGRGSGGEPVLRREVENFLAREAGGRVAEWGRAPARLGGEGALVVFLKR